MPTKRMRGRGPIRSASRRGRGARRPSGAHGRPGRSSSALPLAAFRQHSWPRSSSETSMTRSPSVSSSRLGSRECRSSRKPDEFWPTAALSPDGRSVRPPPARLVRSPARRGPGAPVVARQCGEHRLPPGAAAGPGRPRPRGPRLRLPGLRAQRGLAERAGRLPRRHRRLRRPGDQRDRSGHHRVLRGIPRRGGLHRGRHSPPLCGGHRGLHVHAAGRRRPPALRPAGLARGRPLRFAGTPVARVGTGLRRPRRPGRDRSLRAGRAPVRGGTVGRTALSTRSPSSCARRSR